MFILHRGVPQIKSYRVCVCVGVGVLYGNAWEPLSVSLIVWQGKQTGVEKLKGWVVPEKTYSSGGAFRCMRLSWLLANRSEVPCSIFSRPDGAQCWCPQMTTDPHKDGEDGSCSTRTHPEDHLLGSYLQNREICSAAADFKTRELVKREARGHDRDCGTSLIHLTR